MSEITLTLPDGLAREAKANGLFTPELAASLFRAELRRRQINRLFTTADRLSDQDEPLSEDEVMAEVKAVRNKDRR
mgnify:CR=1 FL=1